MAEAAPTFKHGAQGQTRLSAIPPAAGRSARTLPLAPEEPSVAPNVPSICCRSVRLLEEVLDSPGKRSLPSAGTEKANLPSMNKTILEVDDDIAVRESVRKAFGNAGYEAVLAAGGLEDVARLLANEIDVVLLDIGVANASGWKTWQHLARNGSETPIIVIIGQAGQIKSALADGSVGLMEKPLEPPPLPERIQLLLARSKEPDLCRPNAISYHVAA
jgi:CheY-like chemotaxis protein